MSRFLLVWLAVSMLTLLAACDGSNPKANDAGTSSDSGRDATADSSVDASQDAAVDLTPTKSCEDGGRCSYTFVAPKATYADLAADGTSVYLTVYPDTVISIPVTGGAPRTLANSQNNPHGIAVDATHVYWTNNNGGQIMWALHAGGASALLSGQNLPDRIAVDATNLYWTSNSGLWVMPKGGGTATHPSGTSTSSIYDDVATDSASTEVCWVDSGGSVSGYGTASGGVTKNVVGLAHAAGVATNGANVFFVNSSRQVMSAPSAGGAATPLTTLPGDANDIAADDAYVYVSIAGGGKLMYVPVAGAAAPTVLAAETSPNDVFEIALDATNVYWTTSDGRVRFTAKP